MTRQSNNQPTSVYYDGACPLCSKEINFYKKRVRPGIAWVDVSGCSDDELPENLTKAQALARFHVRLPDGSFRSGPRGFGVVWTHMPGLSGMGRLLQLGFLQPPLELAYRGFLFLRRRFIKRDCKPTS